MIYGVTVGVSARVLLKGQLRWFHDQGWQVVLVTSPDADAFVAAQREGVPLMGIQMARTIALLADLKALISWLRLIRSFKPDVVNVTTPKAALLGMLAAFILGVPKRIYFIAGLRLEGSRAPLTHLLWIMERLTMACATDVVFVSPSLAAAAAARGLRAPGKGWMIGDGSLNGIDVSTVRQSASVVSRSEVRDQLGIGADDFVVGFVGRVAPDKGLDVLREAFELADLPLEAVLLVVGWTEDESLASRLRELGHRVRLTGGVDNVPKYLAAMDVFCFPTRREGFGNVAVEAGAMGLPVVATRATGSVDTVVDGVTGILIDVDDAEGLAMSLEALHRDRSRARRMGEAGRTRAEQDFRPERIWSGLLSIVAGDYDSPELRPAVDMA